MAFESYSYIKIGKYVKSILSSVILYCILYDVVAFDWMHLKSHIFLVLIMDFWLFYAASALTVVQKLTD